MPDGKLELTDIKTTKTMPIISIAHLKGGCGKTTTVANVAAASARAGKKVLVLDADPQANLSQSLGIVEEPTVNLYTELRKEMVGDGGDLRRALIPLAPGFDLIPGSLDLAVVELELVSVFSREQLLHTLLEPLTEEYDLVLIDCPHAIGMLTVNALVASDYVLIPLPAEFLPLKGVHSFMRQFEMIRKKLRPSLKLLGLVLTRYDERKLMNSAIRQALNDRYPGKVFDHIVRTNIQLVKAQEAGKDIFSFDRKSNGAKDYQGVAEEFWKRLEDLQQSPTK
jgi:chromosome partitioning protein